MECMVAFSLALCALGTWEEAASNYGSGWSRIDEGRAATANGGRPVWTGHLADGEASEGSQRNREAFGVALVVWNASCS
jgi:hypothetical protein